MMKNKGQGCGCLCEMVCSSQAATAKVTWWCGCVMYSEV